MRALLVLSLGLWGGLELCASSSTDKSREEAVRELKLLKNSPELMKQPGGAVVELPQTLAPETPAMTLVPGPVLGPESLEKAQKQAKKEQNWLVEGYWRQVREHTHGAEQTAAERTEWMKTTLGADRWVSKGGRNLQVSGDRTLEPEESRRVELVQPEVSRAPDPLQPFLATWLSSRDYQILQKASQQRDGATVEAGQAVPATQGMKPSEQVSENPYLKALNDGLLTASQASSGASAPTTAVGPEGQGSLPGAAVPSSVLPPVSEPEKAVNPLSQKEEDRKYYPQLKRF